MWRGLGVCWVGVAVSWRVAGCCAPCRGGVGASRGWALRATLKGRGGSAGSWHVLGRGGGGVAGRWGLGMPCWVGEVGWWWWGGGAGWRWFACTNGLQSPGSCAVLGRLRWVGGGGVAGQDGGGSHAQMGCNLQGLAPCWGGEVGWRWWGVGAGWRWLACTNGGFACHVGAAGWWWWRVASHVGAACWGRDEWKRLACTRGRQWPATLKLWGWSAWNNGVVIKPPLDTTYLPPYSCCLCSHFHPSSGLPRPILSSPSLILTRGQDAADDALGLVAVQQDMPLPPPRACEPLPFVPAPTRRPDMARNTLPPPTRRPNTACKTFDPILQPIRAREPPPSCPATPPPPTHLADPTRHAKTPPTRHAASMRHARPSRHRPPRHPNTARKTPPPTDSLPPRPNTRQDPADLPHPFNVARKAPATTDPRATPTRRATPRHMPNHRHTKTPPPPTCHVTPTRHATPRRPVTTPTPSAPPIHAIYGTSTSLQ
ncbi:hypothetical protein EDB89DRAFT_1905760 [Lactarius sanguifluus]|nr:hypothetical protein EDB89DRAFT_1905760 [Lactarius sanguifluus]